jgi:hypothetical protein
MPGRVTPPAGLPSQPDTASLSSSRRGISRETAAPKEEQHMTNQREDARGASPAAGRCVRNMRRVHRTSLEQAPTRAAPAPILTNRQRLSLKTLAVTGRPPRTPDFPIHPPRPEPANNPPPLSPPLTGSAVGAHLTKAACVAPSAPTLDPK